MSDLVRRVNDFKFSINNDKQVSGAVLSLLTETKVKHFKIGARSIKKFTQIYPDLTKKMTKI